MPQIKDIIANNRKKKKWSQIELSRELEKEGLSTTRLYPNGNVESPNREHRCSCSYAGYLTSQIYMKRSSVSIHPIQSHLYPKREKKRCLTISICFTHPDYMRKRYARLFHSAGIYL